MLQGGERERERERKRERERNVLALVPACMLTASSRSVCSLATFLECTPGAEEVGGREEGYQAILGRASHSTREPS